MSSALSSSRSRVFSAYRRLFRARAQLFEADRQAMQESRKAIREQFMLNKNAPTSGEHFEGLLAMVDEAEDMLLRGFVQGKLNPETQHYEVKIKKEHTADSDDMTKVPQLEPVTEETAKSFEKSGGVDVTSSSGSSKKDSSPK